MTWAKEGILRLIAVKRISRDTEQSSALDRQEVRLSAAIKKGGHELVAWVEDVTVSGAVNLWDRPALGKWLREPLIHLYDGIIVTEQDRLTRNDLHWWAFVGWCLEHDKQIIILDDPTFDITTPNGRMIASIKAAQAANYREAIRKKRLDQLQWFREERLWPGGKWPFGYRATRIQHMDKKRWRLVPDPVTAPLVREAYDRLVNKGHSMLQIVEDWNARGVLTGSDYQRYCNAKEGREGVRTEVKGHKWTVMTLRNILSSPTLLGYATHKGEVLRKDGLPVQWADPILTPEEFDKLQQVISVRGKPFRNIGKRSSTLIGIVYCICGQRMHYGRSVKTRKSGKRWVFPYYQCKSRSLSGSCPHARSWSAEFLKANLEEMFLAVAGDLEIVEKTFVPGVDRSKDIQQLREAIDNLTGNLSQMTPGSAGAQAIIKAIEQHSEALARLEALPVIPSRWEERGTGQTFREFWERNDWPARADLLRRLGVRLYVGGTKRAPDLDLFLPEDLQRRIVDVLSGTVDPGFVAQMGEAADAAIADRVRVELELQRGSDQGKQEV